MMNKMIVTAAAALLAACGSSGGAASGPPRAAQASADRLDVAGVRPGMPATEVEAVLKRAGWRTQAFPGKDWAAEVAYEAARQRGRMLFDQPRTGVETIQAHKGDEELVIEMKAVPSGPVVKRVGYSAPMAGRTGDQVRAQMLQRYGTPDKDAGPGAYAVHMAWCTGGERCSNFFGIAKPSLRVEEDNYHKLNVFMAEGGDAEQAWRAGVQRAATGGSPPRSSF